MIRLEQVDQQPRPCHLRLRLLPALRGSKPPRWNELSKAPNNANTSKPPPKSRKHTDPKKTMQRSTNRQTFQSSGQKCKINGTAVICQNLSKMLASAFVGREPKSSNSVRATSLPRPPSNKGRTDSLHQAQAPTVAPMARGATALFI